MILKSCIEVSSWYDIDIDNSFNFLETIPQIVCQSLIIIKKFDLNNKIIEFRPR